MNRLLMMTIALTFCTTLSAQTITPPKAPKPVSAEIRSNMLARTGGMLMTPSKGPSILLLNTQKQVPAEVTRAVTEQITKTLRLRITTAQAASSDPMTAALTALADTNNAAVIVVCAHDTYPALLLAPENRWALINVTALAKSGVSAETLADRTKKEVWRAFGYLMGTANSTSAHCLLKPVMSLEDLDALKATSLSFEPFNKIMVYAQTLGISPTRQTTYRKAVTEGWAPAPTNTFQKAIWDELKK